ncbi:hypothetical protein K7862_32885 [Streptomyces sp. PLK6-54]|uniref:DUF6895 domain-containing protein n=1 Tax=Actinacidiphila acidipaludis TaxID=2873382 RepID=A0ABS7QGU8_9ACTN|nr:hypothetical protein [Streptomyces acidipaludis]
MAGCARRTARAALDWLSAHRGGFALGTDPLAAGADANRTWKPLGELAQMCAVVKHLTPPGDRLHDTAGDLLAYAWQQTGAGRLLHDLMRLEPFATYPLEVYAAFAGGGLRHQGVEEAAATLTATRGWRTTEQQPNRRLGMANTERRAGLSPHLAAQVLLRRTWLGALPEPWTFERTAGYTLTHVVFHLTDWGLRPQAVPADVAGYLTAWLPPWLDTCVEDGSWDLTCELLATGASLPRPLPAAFTAAAWRRLTQAQDAAGALPEAARSGGGPLPRVFETCYHSTVMAAFAAVLTIARTPRPPDGPPGGPGSVSGTGGSA